MATRDQQSPTRFPSRPGAETMRAVVRHTYGSADVVRVESVPRPTVGEHEVLVRVHAAGLASSDWHLMTGKPYLMRLATGVRRPRQPVLGGDLAGTVAQVGSAVTRFAQGDEVFGIGRGSFAEYAVAPEAKLVVKPANLTFEQAAVVPVSGLTALQAVCDTGRVQAGQQVLVTGASGGVGSFAVQVAKAYGAEVTGTASTGKLDLVRSLGADHVIDYNRDDFADGVRRYDLIIDIAGNPSLTRLRRALTPAGTAVIVGGEEGGNFSGGMNRQLRALAVSAATRQRLTMFLCRENSADLDRLTSLVEAGEVSPRLDRTYPLAQASDAIRHLAAGRARGKVGISIAPTTYDA